MGAFDIGTNVRRSRELLSQCHSGLMQRHGGRPEELRLLPTAADLRPPLAATLLSRELGPSKESWSSGGRRRHLTSLAHGRGKPPY